MYNLIAFIGEAGSGKDTLLHEIMAIKSDIAHEIVSCTTRPPREGEVDGVNYHFLTGEQFGEKVLKNEMLEATCFNDWFYGTSFDSLVPDKINIGVFNPAGIESLLEYKSKINLIVFYVRATEKERMIRQLNRESDPDIDEIIRRLKADRDDFSDLDFDYIELVNNTKEELQLNIRKVSTVLAGLMA